MRKFTKEISALLAATAMSAGICASTSAETPQQQEYVAGGLSVSDEYLPPEEGEAMPDDIELERTAGVMMIEPETEAPEDFTHPIGTMVYEEPTEEEFPPTAGVPLPPDDEDIPPLAGDVIAPTDEEIPPLAGEPTRPDEFIEPSTTATLPPIAGETMPPSEETEPTLPPMDGGVMPLDNDIKPTLKGDADLNGASELADLTTVAKHVLNKKAYPLKNKVAEANADMNEDGNIDGLDVSELTEDQLGR